MTLDFVSYSCLSATAYLGAHQVIPELMWNYDCWTGTPPTDYADTQPDLRCTSRRKITWDCVAGTADYYP